MTSLEGCWTPVYIGLGSNLGEPETQLREAVEGIRVDADFRELTCSPVYRSEALTLDGTGGEPAYLNAVLLAHTVLTAPKLLRRLQQQEQLQGRERLKRWGSRTLDLDILLYGSDEIDQPGLKVPHYAIASRLFVLQPLADLQSTLSIPGRGPLMDLLADLAGESPLQKTDIELL